ncbi:D12 class N6 adenine-specific DNA methyltransferase [Formosa agariphila KMM 3901]|uniref:site-specific DNA-methyltransferase (adenine-specific) n=1 Tax=Formosa agariphila (strain DSM 15362 / KCTC 12365 / LMG 23005 / KMM 3901 / M-2Alg 35-1) TaxID=1347342 RepID=T2KPX4_FORAG|nr:DNA adenine methylase [Formosa agariphila]CDF80553.1 D12 class N6 adenine-specific DNA methyltransferase [Formosa agariphila KMM 3901]
MSKKVYNTAPLPFMGQKRKFIKSFKDALHNYPPDGIYVDLFGGSGLLAHTAKQHYPNATVVYNDFDNYRKRINAIPETNNLLEKLRMLISEWPKDKRITGVTRENVLKAIKRHEDQYNYVDYITLSSSLLFSMKYVLNYEDLVKSTLYNCIRMSDYKAEGYLNGLDIVSLDYKVLFEQYKDSDKVVFLIDPPYLQTTSVTYKNYWNLTDYLDVLSVLEGHRYFYFTSNKSSIIELCEWVGNRTLTTNPFAHATKLEVNTSVNYNSSYTDIMLFK